jgi:hypothetical protein
MRRFVSALAHRYEGPRLLVGATRRRRGSLDGKLDQSSRNGVRAERSNAPAGVHLGSKLGCPLLHLVGRQTAVLVGEGRRRLQIVRRHATDAISARLSAPCHGSSDTPLQYPVT